MRLFLAALCFGLALVARAEVSLAPLFTDGAVLQRDKPVPIWGRATPGERLTITFAGQTRHATAGRDGGWLAFLDAMPASTAGAELVVTGKTRVVVQDVVVGEVWLCSGQSNMEWPVQRAAHAEREIAAAAYPLIRHVKIDRTVADTPAGSVGTSGWRGATREHVGEFTAVGYFFARELHVKLGVPVGLINSSWGGTPIEAWLSPAGLAADPRFAVVHERWQQTLADFPAKQAAYDEAIARWQAEDAAATANSEQARAAWRTKNPRPRPPAGPGHRSTPAGLFNGMINPLLPYALRGAIWYQGEANAGRAYEYRALFEAMITAWRAHFGQGDLPFYWVNLAGYAVPRDETGARWAWLREAQTQALGLPNTGQAFAIDLGEPDDIHPRNKQEVGRRLALLARNRVYDIVSDDTGPTFAGATRDGAGLRVRFTSAENGLLARGKPVQSLELAAADRVFHPASGKIDGNTLLVTAPAVKEPVAVRYAWKNWPEANLYNGAGLPAVPFRSDKW